MYGAALSTEKIQRAPIRSKAGFGTLHCSGLRHLPDFIRRGSIITCAARIKPYRNSSPTKFRIPNLNPNVDAVRTVVDNNWLRSTMQYCPGARNSGPWKIKSGNRQIWTLMGWIL